MLYIVQNATNEQGNRQRPRQRHRRWDYDTGARRSDGLDLRGPLLRIDISRAALGALNFASIWWVADGWEPGKQG